MHCITEKESEKMLCLLKGSTHVPWKTENGWRLWFSISKTPVVEQEQSVLGADPQCLFKTLLGRLVVWSLTTSGQWNKWCSNPFYKVDLKSSSIGRGRNHLILRMIHSVGA